MKLPPLDVGRIRRGDERVRVRGIADDEHAHVAARSVVDRAALGREDLRVREQEVLALHAGAARARADQHRVVAVLEGRLRVVGRDDAVERREGAVGELHHDAGERGQRGRDLEQLQVDRAVGAEHLPGRDAEGERVADVAGGAGDGDGGGFFSQSKLQQWRSGPEQGRNCSSADGRYFASMQASVTEPVMSGEPQIHPGETDEFAWHATENWLPSVVDVAIIGGGIIGCSTAYFLARSGVSVAVFEKGRIGGEQSGRNWGWVRQQCRSPVELPLMMQSLRLWKELPAQLGEDLGFRQGGTLYLAENETELAGLAEWLAVAREHGLDTSVIAGRELKAAFAAGDRWTGALYTASDGRAEPSRATRAIARGAKAAGAVIASRTAVRGIESAAGRVSGVVTEHGRVAARAVVCAAGAWTRLFCGSLGIRVPQLPVLNSVARTAPAPELLAGQAWSPAIAIRRRADGGYTVAHGHTSIHSIVPASFREGLKYLPAFRASRESVRITVGRRVLPRPRDALALAARSRVALRARARPESGAGCAGAARDAREPFALAAGARGHALRRDLGRHDRDVPGRPADHRAGRKPRGFLHCDRLQRAWLRHWPRRR